MQVGSKSHPSQHRSFISLHIQRRSRAADSEITPVISNSNAAAMASISPLHFSAPATTALRLGPHQHSARRSLSRVVAVSAFGDVSSDSSLYLFAGAAAVALIGTALPLLFSRRDLCPECDGAGFIRQAGAPLRANAARKDQPQIVCPRCNGLGKLGQIDK